MPRQGLFGTSRMTVRLIVPITSNNDRDRQHVYAKTYGCLTIPAGSGCQLISHISIDGEDPIDMVLSQGNQLPLAEAPLWMARNTSQTSSCKKHLLRFPVFVLVWPHAPFLENRRPFVFAALPVMAALQPVLSVLSDRERQPDYCGCARQPRQIPPKGGKPHVQQPQA